MNGSEGNGGIDELLEFEGKTSVLPMYASKSELEPATEVIVCSAVSGRAHYVNNMPKSLTLTRRLLSGEEYNARYVMIEEGRQGLSFVVALFGMFRREVVGVLRGRHAVGDEKVT